MPSTYTSFTLSPASSSASCATSLLKTVGGHNVFKPVLRTLPLMPGKKTTLEQHSAYGGAGGGSGSGFSASHGSNKTAPYTEVFGSIAFPNPSGLSDGW